MALPETEAHSPEELRKAMLISGSDLRSSVLPDSVFVWKRRSIPPDSWDGVRIVKIQGRWKRNCFSFGETEWMGRRWIVP